jgi:hypothetical protein
MPWESEFDIRQIDDTYFRLLDNLVYYSKKYNIRISAPYGMVSDGPSVGRWPILFWLFGKKGKRAAVIHDWLYRCGFFTRAICDDIYKEAHIESGYNWTAKGMFAGVRVGGGPHYAPIGKAGCLDPRERCTFVNHICTTCPNYLASYKLTVVTVLQ